MQQISTNIILLVLLVLLPGSCQGQRFLRETGQMDNDFRAESQLDDPEAMQGMTREMFLMHDLQWELEPPTTLTISDRKIRKHIQKYLRDPVRLKLLKRKGKYGLRAVGQLQNGKKLRAFWRQSNVGQRMKANDFTELSYDQAVRSRLFNVEFEVQLPPLPGSKDPLPVVYQVPFESGNMNPKSMVPRGAGLLCVYPVGHEKGPRVDAGKCSVGIPIKPGLVDPSWARGRTVFRKGRTTGLM